MVLLMKKKIIVMSFCEPDDNTCGIELNEYPGIDILVVNADEITWSQDQFSCLLSGGTNSENYREYDSISQAGSEKDELKEEICDKPVPIPTPRPTP